VGCGRFYEPVIILLAIHNISEKRSHIVSVLEIKEMLCRTIEKKKS
jgi:hypothetical protein